MSLLTLSPSHTHLLLGVNKFFWCVGTLRNSYVCANSQGIVLWDSEQVLLVVLEWRKSLESVCSHLYSLSFLIRPNNSDRTIFLVAAEQILFSVQYIDTSWD